jgi:hypothetical protein
MIGKVLVGAILGLGCTLSLAAQTTPSILVGGCGALDGGIRRVPYVVFGLGQYDDSNCGDRRGKPVTGIPMPSAGTLQNLHVTIESGVFVGGGGVLTIYVNGESTDLSCTGDASGKCSDTTHTISVNAGDEVGATYTPGPGLNLGITVSLEKQ